MQACMEYHTEYRLFYRALLQKRPILLRRLLIVAIPYLTLAEMYQTHTFESWRTHEWVMAHTWMSHGTHMNESWHRCNVSDSRHDMYSYMRRYTKRGVSFWMTHEWHMNNAGDVWDMTRTHWHDMYSYTWEDTRREESPFEYHMNDMDDAGDTNCMVYVMYETRHVLIGVTCTHWRDMYSLTWRLLANDYKWHEWCRRYGMCDMYETWRVLIDMTHTYRHDTYSLTWHILIDMTCTHRHDVYSLTWHILIETWLLLLNDTWMTWISQEMCETLHVLIDMTCTHTHEEIHEERSLLLNDTWMTWMMQEMRTVWHVCTVTYTHRHGMHS